MSQAAKAVMVLGTSSGAGKSWLATALCRWYARQGLVVRPFKAQNMSNNARVVAAPDGGLGEIGSAQYFQALAARARPDVRMNPLLLKPEADTRSQVVLMGRVDEALSRTPWRERGPLVWPRVAQALDSLRAECDVLVIEGAGSPAEINLMDSDIVNLRVARHADARSLLVTDIDRGGAFAHLYGTWALLPEADRARLAGFVLNKFRGDEALLAPAPEQLQALTGVPVLATLPMWRDHGLPEEDGVFDAQATGEAGAALKIAVLAYPRISNLDEFQPLRQVGGVRLVWARSVAELDGADIVVLPGSKSTAADLAWLRARGLDAAAAAHPPRRRRAAGGCGGPDVGAERRLVARDQRADRHRGHRRQRAWPGPAAAGDCLRARQGAAPHARAPGRGGRRVASALGRDGGGLRNPPRPDRPAPCHGRQGRRGARSGAWPGLAERRRQRAGPVPARPV